MEFPAVKAQTERSKHPLLIYRLISDEDQCYKFDWKRTNSSDHSYVCQGCKQAAKLDPAITVNSIHVSNDYSTFSTDPEAMNHACEVFHYLSATTQQTYR